MIKHINTFDSVAHGIYSSRKGIAQFYVKLQHMTTDAWKKYFGWSSRFIRYEMFEFQKNHLSSMILLKSAILTYPRFSFLISIV